MPRFRYAVFACALTLASGLLVAGSPAATAADPTYTTTTLHFKVTVGPETLGRRATSSGTCTSPRTPPPASGCPRCSRPTASAAARTTRPGSASCSPAHGYVALSYSGLGFGGSSCEITLDDPVYDGQAAAQLIDYLGGADGIAFTDAAHTQPVARLNKVKLDEPGDPRVGMFGGSYGGQVQYAAASVTPKLDTIVPLITWNDLSYSLGPNNTDQIKLPGQELLGVSTDTPGSVKTNWALAFSAIGLTGDAANQQPDNPLGTQCPNFRQDSLPSAGERCSHRDPGPDAVDFLRRRLGGQLPGQGEDPDADPAGPGGHLVQPQRGGRELPGVGCAEQRRSEDELDQLRPLRGPAPRERSTSRPRTRGPR